MFGAGRTNATGNEGLSDQSANSGYNQRSSYATRFGAGNPQSNNLGGSSQGSNVSASYDFAAKKGYGSMTDNFGPGKSSGPNSFLSPDK